MYRYYLAQRFTISRPINLLGIFGVMLGVWALVVVVSIFDGYRAELSRQFTMATSDLTVLRIHPYARFSALREVIEADPNVAACAPRMVWMGMIHPRSAKHLRTWLPGAIHKNGRFVRITGIDPVLEGRTSGLLDWLREADAGLRVAPDELQHGGNWILLSTRRAAAGGLAPAERLEITLARTHYHRDGQTMQLVKSGFVFAGGFKTRHAGFDNLAAFVSIDRLRELISQANPEIVNEIAIKLRRNDEAALKETRRRLEDAFAVLPDLRGLPPGVQAAGEQDRLFMRAIGHQSGLMKLVLFVIMVVAGFLVYATLSMMVTEKKHDIGVLSALGGTRVGVLTVFLSSGFTISFVGTVFGALTGCFTSVYLNDFNEWLKRQFDIDLFPSDIYNLPSVPYDLDPVWISIVIGCSLALGLLASALPAWRAMRNDPLQCLRDQ